MGECAADPGGGDLGPVNGAGGRGATHAAAGLQCSEAALHLRPAVLQQGPDKLHAFLRAPDPSAGDSCSALDVQIAMVVLRCMLWPAL